MLPLHPFYTARKAKGTFYSGRQHSRKPSRSRSISCVSAYREEAPAAARVEHFTQEKEHSTQEKEHFTQEKEHFTQGKYFFLHPKNPVIARLFGLFAPAEKILIYYQ